MISLEFLALYTKIVLFNDQTIEKSRENRFSLFHSCASRVKRLNLKRQVIRYKGGELIFACSDGGLLFA